MQLRAAASSVLFLTLCREFPRVESQAFASGKPCYALRCARLQYRVQQMILRERRRSTDAATAGRRKQASSRGGRSIRGAELKIIAAMAVAARLPVRPDWGYLPLRCLRGASEADSFPTHPVFSTDAPHAHWRQPYPRVRLILENRIRLAAVFAGDASVAC